MNSKKSSRSESVRLTGRDLQILQKLNAAGWLTTEQLRNFFFTDKSTRMVCKRLRKLVTSGYVAAARTSSTKPALYRLASRGRLALIERTALSEADISIPSQLPRKIEHFTAINDLRFHFEQLGVHLSFFFSERELCSYYQNQDISDPIILLLKKYGIVPDAVAKVCMVSEGLTREVTIALEYDAGTEHVAFFGRTKVRQYSTLFEQHAEWVGDFKVLTFACSVKRVVSLMQQTVQHQPPSHMFYFAVMEKLNEQEWEAREIFLDPYDFFEPVRRGNQVEVIEKDVQAGAVPRHALIAVPASCSRKGFLRQNT